MPHYVSQSSSPKATLALVERSTRILDTSVDVVELRIASAAYERQINELVASDDDASAYVSRLEEQDADARPPEADQPPPDEAPASAPPRANAWPPKSKGT